MKSSRLAQPPSFSRLRALLLWRSLELFLWIMGVTVACCWWWCVIALFPGEVPPQDFTPLEATIALATGPACLLAAWQLRRRDQRVAAGEPPRVAITEPAVALVALPTNPMLATISRLPLMARLLGARLEFVRDAIAIKWRWGEQRIAHREIARADWQHDGVLLLLRDGRRLLVPTCHPPRFSGLSGYYPEIGQAVQSVTLAVLRHNQDIAERIRWECERIGGPSYRRAPRSLD